jgi:hypothetical protein
LMKSGIVEGQGPQASRLFIVGAGASYGAGLPDANRVLTHLVGYMTGPWMPVANRSPMAYFEPLVAPLIEIARRFGGGERFPLDEVTDHFHRAAKRDLAQFGPLLAMLYKAIRELMYSRSLERAEAFQAFASALRPGDILLTFNWDLCLEIALAAAGVRFDRSLAVADQPGVVRILKPHGSIDDIVITHGTQALIGKHSIVDRYGLEPPGLAPGWPVRYELVRLRTYDLPIWGRLEWNDAARRIDLRIIGERDASSGLGTADVFALQLERILGDASPFLFTPSTPRKLYQWMYDLMIRIVQSVNRPIGAIYVAGYSFPKYDSPVFEVLSAMSAHLGRPATHVVNPAAHELPLDVLNDIFGRVELHATTFGAFDWHGA